MKYLLLIAIILGTVACEKNADVMPAGTLLIVNAPVGVASAKVNYMGPHFIYGASPDVLASGAAKSYPLPVGSRGLVIVNAADTTQKLFDGTYNTENGVMSSLYICGQAPAFDTILRKESLPMYADSVMGIRFVNLVPNSKTLNIRIKDGVADEVSGLGYKGITSFKTYPAKRTNTSYVFEVRDAATGALLTTYTQNVAVTARFRNIAVVLKGLQGTSSGSNAFGAFTVNYY